MLPNISQNDALLSCGLAFVGGYSDATSLILAKSFTGHVTGNLVLGAIAVAAHQWRTALEHLSAIITFVMGICVSAMIVRPLKKWSSWPLLPTVMGMEVILMAAASLLLSSHVTHGVEMFVILVSLALGLQNGAFRRIGGISVHTTYLTGMITSLVSTEAEQYVSEVKPAVARVSDPKIGLFSGIWITFVLGAGTGAVMALHFNALGMLVTVLLLMALMLREVLS